ncbi:MAG: response regulator transcription factor [Planctomycetaceae bacterium]|nr:response regulator transcription factor [Planctomycetaceae bacterium]
MTTMSTPPTQSPTGTSQVLIVDSQPIVRYGLRCLLQLEPDLNICGEALGLSQAVQLAHELNPDLIITDVALADGSGLELVKEIASGSEGPAVLVCSMQSEMLFADRALRAGARGYISKEEPTDLLLAAIRRILDGRIYLSEQMTDRMLSRSVGSSSEDASQSPVETLSDRELEVFGLIGQGVTTRQIAERLHLSPKTVETYRENIKLKLGLQNAAELTQRAVQWVLES